jgi:hypothetical protein
VEVRETIDFVKGPLLLLLLSWCYWRKFERESCAFYGVVYATHLAAMTIPTAKNNTILTIWTI